VADSIAFRTNPEKIIPLLYQIIPNSKSANSEVAFIARLMNTPARFGIILPLVPGSSVRIDLNESERNRTISRWPCQKYNKRNTKYYTKVGRGGSTSPLPGKIFLNCTELDFLDFLDSDYHPISQFPAQTRKPFLDQSNFRSSGCNPRRKEGADFQETE
jgi:hypothetical protein